MNIQRSNLRALALAALVPLFACVPPVTDKYACTTKADCLSGYSCVEKVCVAVDKVCDGWACGHGTCAVKDEMPSCTCEANWSGDRCDACATGFQDKDGNGSCTATCATAALSCGHGTCDDASGTARCGCETGYTGDACDACADGYQDKDGDHVCTKTCATAALTCGHGGCDDSSGTAKCACENGYQGDSCDECAAGFQDRDENGTCTADCATAGLACGHGACDDGSGTAHCACETGYLGDACDACAAGYQDRDSNGTCAKDCTTAALTCGHGACDDASGTAICACEAHYQGDACEACVAGYQDKDGDTVCAPDCATANLACHHGSCTDASGAAKCSCETGYTGADCQACATGYQDNDHNGTCTPTCTTAGLSCGHGACTDTSGTAQCACDTGYAGASCNTCAANYVDIGGACRPRTIMMGSSNGFESATTLLEDGSGFLLAGNVAGGDTTIFGGTTTLDPASEGYIAAYDPAGAPRWNLRVTGSNRKGFTSIVRDAAGNLAGFGVVFPQTLLFNGAHPLTVGNGCMLVGLTPDGGYRFARYFNAYNCDTMAVDAAGNLYVVGMSGDTDFGGGQVTSAGGLDAFIASYAPDGSFRWAKLLGGPAGGYGAPQEEFTGVAVDGSGNVFVTGYISAATNFGTGVLDPKTNAALSAPVAVSFTNTGTTRWAKMWPRLDTTDTNASGSGQRIAVDKTGVVAIAAQFRGRFDFGGGAMAADPAFAGQNATVYLTLRSSDGSYLHQRGILTGLPLYTTQLVFDANNDLHVVGNINNSGGDLGGGTTHSGAFRAHYRNDLTHVSSQVAGGGAYPIAYSISVRPDGSSLVMGTTQTSIDWGYGVGNTAGYTDLWLTWFP